MVEIAVVSKASGKASFDQNGDTKAGKLPFECRYRAREEETIPHRSKPDQKDTCPRRQLVKEVFSLQFSLR